MKSIVSVIIFCISTIASYSQTNKHLLPLSTLLKSTELTERYLKLGNTYREAKQFDIALIYLNKGLTLAINSNNVYWTAVAYEFKGYLYRDNGDVLSAKEYLEKAKVIYEKIIKMEKGSNQAVDLVIQGLNNKKVNLANTTIEPVSNPLEVIKLKKDIEEYKLRISTLEKENSQLRESKAILNESKSSKAIIIPDKKDLAIDHNLISKGDPSLIKNTNKVKANEDDSISKRDSLILPLRGPDKSEIELNSTNENLNKGVVKPKRPALPKPISEPK